MLPLHHRDIILVPLHRIELQTSDYKTDVIPFNYKGKVGAGCRNRTYVLFRAALSRRCLNLSAKPALYHLIYIVAFAVRMI